jgi:formylglycine-generating enzyme required for sulfatase activity
MNRRNVVAFSVLVMTSAFLGLGGCDDGGKDPGSEGGPCYGNWTCDGWLECRYGVCVKPSVVPDVIQGTDPGLTVDERGPTDPGGTWDPGGTLDPGGAADPGGIADSGNCIPNCSGRVCGPDPVCGESCGTCGDNENCTAAGACVTKVPVCPGAKDCTGRVCGPDPICDESCGTCSGDKGCNADGQCVSGGCGIKCGEMVTVPGGLFWQGCNESVDTECYDSEKPYHQVNVPLFEIDKYELTVSLYGSCVTKGGCTVPSTNSSYCNWGATGKEDHPVNCITWYQAREYCAWAGRRLCSESEWEKASRGTDGRKFPWGNWKATCNIEGIGEAVHDPCRCDGATCAVGSKPSGASPYGALDMSGNVFEWVEDDYHNSYNGAPTNGRAWVDGPRDSHRVKRGGSFARGVGASVLRSSYRTSSLPADAFGSIGVRCCRSK